MKGKKDCKIISINFNQVSVCTAVLVCLEFTLTLNYMLTEFKITELFIISIANQINAHRIEAIRVAPPSKKDANESCFQSEQYRLIFQSFFPHSTISHCECCIVFRIHFLSFNTSAYTPYPS